MSETAASKLTLVFADHALESEYRDRAAAQVRRQMRIAWPTLALVLVAMRFIDQVIIPTDELQAAFSVVRYGLALPTVVLAWAATFLPARAFRTWGVAVQVLSAAVLLTSVPITGAVLHFGNAAIPAELVHYGLVAFVLGTVAIYGLLTAPFLFVALGCLAAGVVDVVVISQGAVGREFAFQTAFWVAAANGIGMVCSYSLENARRRDFLLQREIDAERKRSDALLLNVLPASIAERLKRSPMQIADAYADATILFADLVGFTALAQRTGPGELVALLNELFSSFDELAEKHQLEKIKTIGDAYMVVGGVPNPSDDHTARVAQMAIDMLTAVRALAERHGAPLELRIGIHAGPVVAGIIGTRKFAFDLWGDAVNIASRLESHGQPSAIHVSQVVADRLSTRFVFEPRGAVQLKGKGALNTFFLRSSADGDSAAATTKKPVANAP